MPSCTLLPSQLVAPVCRYVRVFRKGKQMCALDGPTAALALYGTLLPPVVPPRDLPGTPGWDDAWYGHQTRLTHSPPSHVPAPTSKAAHPPPLPQMKVLLLPNESPQGRLHALQPTGHDGLGYQLFVPMLFVLLAAPGDTCALQSSPRPPQHCVQGVHLLATRKVHRSRCNLESER